MLVLYSLNSMRPVSLYHPRSILVQHVQHTRFPRNFLATSSWGSHENAMRKSASVQIWLFLAAFSTIKFGFGDLLLFELLLKYRWLLWTSYFVVSKLLILAYFCVTKLICFLLKFVGILKCVKIRKFPAFFKIYNILILSAWTGAYNFAIIWIV